MSLSIPYSDARPLIRVGDIIGCRGFGFVSRAIRKLSRGEWDLSHVSIIIRDIGNEGTGRVEVLEALGKGGMRRNYLSQIYEKDHGAIFWLRMHAHATQQQRIMDLGAEILEDKIKYDFRTTWLAVFGKIFVDAKKFNCSESAWYLETRSGVLSRRHDEDGREIAPTPSEFPTWSGVDPIQLVFK